MMIEPAYRAVCARCRRPEQVCYCAHVTPLETKTKVVILQHPRERDVPINTARIAALCLPDSELHVGIHWDKPLGTPDRPAVLLYPGPGAIDIEREPPKGPVTLVVVDGTWWQARKLVRANPALARLPRYAFRPEQPSDYRIRKEPQADYVSTIEALAHLLGVLEGDPARFAAMLTPFRAMVDTQLAYAAKGNGRHRRVPKPRRIPDPRTRLPPLLRERGEDLLCVYGEGNAWPFGTPERAAGEDELVHWVALRVATGERFEAIVAPSRILSPGTPRHTEIDPSVFETGITREAFLAAWSEFARPDDLVAWWGSYTPELLARAGGSLGPVSTQVDLRCAARQFTNARLGPLEAYIARLGLPEPPSLGRGRAGRRLAQMAAIAAAINAKPPPAREDDPVVAEHVAS
jgi:DTW domain-containing protein